MKVVHEFGCRLLTKEVQHEADSAFMDRKQQIRIIVADDHTIFRDSLCKMLALESDFEIVAQAGNGREVVELAADQDPDIVLLDLRMPGLDGLEALRQLRSQNSNAKVIVLTAVDDEDVYVKAVRYGAAGVVVKQTATNLLIKSIRKVHAGEIWLDSKTTAAVIRAFTTDRKAPPIDRHPLPLSSREREVSGLVVQGFLNRGSLKSCSSASKLSRTICTTFSRNWAYRTAWSWLCISSNTRVRRPSSKGQGEAKRDPGCENHQGQPRTGRKRKPAHSFRQRAM